MTVLDDAPTRNGHTVATTVATTALPDSAPAAAPAVAPIQVDIPATAAPAPGPAAPAKTPEQRVRSQARQFFWGWLLFAMAVSIGGNVIHAWMSAPVDRRFLAAIAAAVPPAVLLGSTHSVALLIRTRRRDYRLVDAIVLGVGMLLTVGVAVCAFTMSFFSLRDLMLMLGVLGSVAWLWPVAVDLSLICSSLGLLSLTEPEAGAAESSAPSTPAAAAVEAAVTNNGPSAPAERRLWWESIAAVVREEVSDYRKVADLSPGKLGEILQRMYDENESGRSITDSTGLHHREVKAIKESADGVLARTAVVAAPAGAA